LCCWVDGKNGKDGDASTETETTYDGEMVEEEEQLWSKKGEM
jgi:hypothetical protein